MLVCWEWLSQYTDLSASPAEMASRFAMSGLNHESTEQIGSDTILDLEVTSNRGDCLGHIGVAREAAVLLGQPLTIPAASPKSTATRIGAMMVLALRVTDHLPSLPDFRGAMFENSLKKKQRKQF